MKSFGCSSGAWIACCLILVANSGCNRAEVLDFTESNFEDVIASHSVVFVTLFIHREPANYRVLKFYSTEADEINARFSNNKDAAFGKVDCLRERDLCRKFSMIHLPSVVVVINGTEKETLLLSYENDLHVVFSFIDMYLYGPDDFGGSGQNSSHVDDDDWYDDEWIANDTTHFIIEESVPTIDLRDNPSSDEIIFENFTTDYTTYGTSTINYSSSNLNRAFCLLQYLLLLFCISL